MSTRLFGARVKRTADPQLLRGEGLFIDDILLPNALHVAFVRSPFARAGINPTCAVGGGFRDFAQRFMNRINELY